MTRAACADLIAKADPDRLRTARLAGDRAWRLHALHAFDLELARIPGLVSEPMLGEIRLQWWRDVVAEIFDGKTPRAHEVVAPLAEAIRAGDLPRAPLDALMDARAIDIHGLQPADDAALASYLEGAYGAPMQLGALALGADAATGALAARVGAATGLGLLIRALPRLYAEGADPIPAGEIDRAALGEGRTPAPLAAALRALASDALARLERTRAERAAPEAIPALVAHWTAEPVLRAALRPGFDLFDGARESEFRKNFRLMSKVVRSTW
jgi:phytoene synthase